MSASLRIQRLILLAPRLLAVTHWAPFLHFAEPFLEPAFFLMPPVDLALFMAFPTALRVSVLTTAFTTTFPIPPMRLSITTFQDFCAPGRVATGPALVHPARALALAGLC